jgi:hypothetical protein
MWKEEDDDDVFNGHMAVTGSVESGQYSNGISGY